MKPIQQAVQDYLNLRRALGFELAAHKNTLRDFALFLEKRGAAYVTADLTVEFAKKTRTGSRYSFIRRLSIIRGFAMHRSTQDTRTEIIPAGLFPYREQRLKPYIYSPSEIQQLVDTCKTIPTRGLQNYTYSCVIGLLAVTGMRRGEVVRLNDDCADLENGILKVENTKFNKSRFIPLHSSTIAVLREYKERRNELHPTALTPSFFVSGKGQSLKKGEIWRFFVRASKSIGLRKESDRRGPRIHDLRHSFAVHTMIRWYQQGKNVDQCIAQLSTYLGHDCPENTYWYLTAVPELMVLAARRLEKQMEDHAHEI